jgi:hypothetical protein
VTVPGISDQKHIGSNESQNARGREHVQNDISMNEKWWEWIQRLLNAYRATMFAYGLIFPYVAAVITILALVQPASPPIIPQFLQDLLWVPENPFLTGILAAVLIGLLTPFVSMGLATARGINWRNWAEIDAQRKAIAKTRDCLCASLDSPSAEGQDRPEYKRIACENIGIYLDHVVYMCRRAGPQWLMGHGYMHLWQVLHHADDELIAIEPREALLQRALQVRLRLRGSQIPDCEELVGLLDRNTIAYCTASVTMSDGQPAVKLEEPSLEAAAPSASAQMPQLAHQQPVERAPDEQFTKNPAVRLLGNSLSVSDGSVPGIAGGTAATFDAIPEPSARITMRVVQRAIRSYRDGQWSSLIEVRNRLLKTTMVTQFGALAMLGIAVTAGGGTEQRNTVVEEVIAATAFFLVGGVVGGLYSRLRTAYEAETAVEDYGLAMARLFATPLFSGVAAIGGVALTEALTQLAQGDQTESIGSMFALTPTHLILAALFGLVPARFFDRLGQAGTQVSNLSSTEALSMDKRPASTGMTDR